MYFIRESKVPTDYEREPNGDVKFTVGANGEATITSNSGDMTVSGTIQILNAPMDYLWGNKYPDRYPDMTGKKKETEKPKSEQGKETEKPKPGTSVKTGDDTPIIPWLFTGLTALLGIAFVLICRRRRQSGN